MSALAYGQHLHETLEDDRAADAREDYISEYRPDARDFAFAFDSICESEQLYRALSADLSVAQGRFISPQEIDEAISDAYAAAHEIGGQYAMKRLAALLGEACLVAGRTAAPLIQAQIDRIAADLYDDNNQTEIF